MTDSTRPDRHTAGPWRWSPSDLNAGQDESETLAGTIIGDGYHVASIHSDGGLPFEANAARIVACVNGCEGIADPGAVGELLEAAKDALQLVYHQSDGRRPWARIETQLRAAITRAEGRS